jgi:predicted DNA-binding protein (MmcQ/YjbR family)
MAELRAFGLGFPGAHTKSPWPGHLDLAVKNKTFAFMSTDGEPFSLTCKLPSSGVAALMLPFASAAAYGLGKSGWVNAKFEQGVQPPAEAAQIFKEWIEESYRATAPKKLAAALGAAASGELPKPPPKAASAARKQAPKKKAPLARGRKSTAAKKNVGRGKR